MAYRITVPGRPVPAKRMTQRTKWSPGARRALAYQEQVAWAAKAARVPVLCGDVKLYVRFYFSTRRHGDVDNLCKAIADGLQYGGVIPNDRRVMYLDAGILYGEPERAEIELSEVV